MIKWLALFAALGLAPAQAQNFTMPPPAGVFVGGFEVVASCAAQSLTSAKPGFGTMDTTGALCVNATVSASVTGFTPNGSFATLTSAASSADSALPTGTTDLLQNTGTTAVSCNLTIGAGSSTASKIVIQAGSTEGVVVGSNTHYSCINQAGDSASNVVVAAGGAGLSTTFGGGGGGGGSGGAVTIANGADVALGNNTDAASCASGTSALACFRQLHIDITSAIPPATPPYGIIGGVINGADTYNTIAATQTTQALTGGSGGATGDYLSHCVIQPTTTAAGTVIIYDNSTAIFTFTTGTLSNLVPFTIPVGAVSVSGAWKVTTGANETATCVGKFH